MSESRSPTEAAHSRADLFEHWREVTWWGFEHDD